ncbi:MAG: hypothetical protein GX495_02620 [Chloroflexi bacterium]|jgi:hypothetical protein|nr:hypothetical protein [Chloroflexota bacterium]
MTAIEIGRLLRAGTAGFVVGCRVNQLDSPSFGALASVPLGDGYKIYGLIYDIRIDDDGLVRQLVTADGVDESVIADNRINRNVPVEISLLTIGYQQGGRIYHLLPPRPPLSLDVIYLCQQDELCQFTAAGRFGYFRHILRARDLPVGELIAAHIRQAHQAHCAAGKKDWISSATQEIITLLRDDYVTLMAVMGALGDAVVDL